MLTALPVRVTVKKRVASMLALSSLITDRVIGTRGSALMQSIRLAGTNGATSEDAHLDRNGGLLAGFVGQMGTELPFFYLHKVSEADHVALSLNPNEFWALWFPQNGRRASALAPIPAQTDKHLTGKNQATDSDLTVIFG